MDKDNLRNLFAMLGPEGRRSTSPCAHALEPQIESIRVHIIGPSGHTLMFKCDINKKLVDLMNQALFELRKNPTKLLIATDPFQQYRLIRADFEAVELDENLTLKDLEIVDNETMLMLERRNTLQQYLKKIDNNFKPTPQQIQTATQFLQIRCDVGPALNSQEVFYHANHAFGLRKIMIPLAKASAAIIGAGPLAKQVIASIKQRLINRRNTQQDALDSLIELGFNKKMADYAMKLSNGVYAKALEKVLQCRNDEMPPEGAFALDKTDSLISISELNAGDSVVKNTEALLQIVHIYSTMKSSPSLEAIELFLEMGFDKQEAFNALTKTYNNIPDACAYLCGDRDEYLTELHDGVGQNSPILKTILEIQAVQSKMGDPMIFNAFLSILEKESAITPWISDSESDVIKIIFATYNKEKHAIALNKLNKNHF